MDLMMADSMDTMMDHCLVLKWVEKMVAGRVATKAAKKALRLVAVLVSNWERMMGEKLADVKVAQSARKRAHP